MKIIFFGIGSIGQKHLRLINKHFDHEVYAYRTYKHREATNRVKIKAQYHQLGSWSDIDKVKPDIAFITNPTHWHVHYAQLCADRNMHLFIEKPISCSTGSALYKLVNTVKRNNLFAYIAYPLRFHPSVKLLWVKSSVKKIGITKNIVFKCATDMSKWRNYKTYSAHYDQGGGAILELSHEIDLAQYLLGEIVKIDGVISRDAEYRDENRKPYTDAETYANLVLHHKYGYVSRLILDIASKEEERFVAIDNSFYNLEDNQDRMLLDQLQYFFARVEVKKYLNRNNLNKEYSSEIEEALPLFEKIIAFRKNRYEQDLGIS